jgi:hypothetical protein
MGINTHKVISRFNKLNYKHKTISFHGMLARKNSRINNTISSKFKIYASKCDKNRFSKYLNSKR